MLVAALLVGCATAGCVASGDEPATGSTEQALSGEWYVSWSGRMNASGTAYDDGKPYRIKVGVNINDDWFCELTGINGNLTGAVTNAVSITPDSSGDWWLQARAAPGNIAGAAAVCFPETNAWWWEPTPGGFPAGSQYYSGIMAVGAVTGNPARVTVSDEGTNPNVAPLHYGTWTLTTSNVNSGEVWPGYWSWTKQYSAYWNWNAVSGSITKTMPAGTSCFLTSIDGNLQQNSFTNGAVATVNYSTGAWTFTAASGTNAWWLCLD
jgi:hypothetical protein